LVSSAEPKARQTLEAAGPVVTDARFNEVRRPREPFNGDFRAQREAYASGIEHARWEPRAEVVARFSAGIRYWSDVAAGRPVVIATHGMAMTTWLAAAVGLTDPGAFWAQLRLPDPYRVDRVAKTVERLSPTKTP
jgi:broad specificity phosphatase PhoE